MNEQDDTARAARRTGYIFAAVIVAAATLAFVWMIPELNRISRNSKQRQRESMSGSQMVRVQGGKFTMGANDGADDERPLHDVQVNDFLMDCTEVTNAEFARFVEATGYLTTAELAQPQPGSWCVREGLKTESPDRREWVVFKPGASWRRPRGADSGIDGKEKFPVVHVSWDDAMAYCKWAGKRLPTEAEWECAARGGVFLTQWPWGNDASPNGMAMGNFLKAGTEPDRKQAEMPDFTRQAGSFRANSFGLHDLAGNVAEWCADWYQHDFYAQLRPDPNRAAHRNPRGPDTSTDPASPGVSKRVVRGGSFLSLPEECRVSARGREEPRFSSGWIGFRCVKDLQ